MLYYVITQTNHYISEVDMSNLVFPDSLLEIWDWWHISSNQQEEKDSEMWKLLQNLEREMKELCKNSKFRDDAVHNALYDLLIKSSREDLESYKKDTYLARKIRQKIAISQNPEGYDVDRKVRGAIRVLIKENKLQSSLLKKKCIVNTSLFKLVSAPDTRASYRNYELHKSEIPFYKRRTSKRGERKSNSLITPNIAKDLVEKLLKCFNGWVEYQDIKKAVWNHIPHSILIDYEEDIDNKNEQGMPEAEDTVYQAISDKKILSSIYIQTLRKICEDLWIRICKKTRTDFFCLYILPEYLGGTAIGNLEDYGNDSTMSGQKKDIMKMLKDQIKLLLGDIKGQSCFFYMKENDVSLTTTKDMFSFLNHRCKEKGYDPHINQKSMTSSTTFYQITKHKKESYYEKKN